MEIGPPAKAPIDAEALARWLQKGRWVARRHPGRPDHFQCAPALPRRRLTHEARAALIDLIMFEAGRRGAYGPDGRRMKIGPKGDPTRWHAELLRDAYKARQPEQVRAFRRQWGLNVTVRELAEVRTVMERTGVFTTLRPREFGPDLRARYSVRRVQWGGVASLYAVLSRALGISPMKDEDARPQPTAGKHTVVLEQRNGRAPATTPPGGALCAYRRGAAKRCLSPGAPSGIAARIPRAGAHGRTLRSARGMLSIGSRKSAASCAPSGEPEDRRGHHGRG